jgi:anaerobic selenocysteine-containing dehydrogenase
MDSLKAQREERIANPWGPRTPYGPAGDASDEVTWPVRVDSHLEAGVSEHDVDRWVQSASVLHSNGDAFDFAVRGGRLVGVRGIATDRVNRGRLDPKDLFGWQAIGSPDRLTRPMVRRDGELRASSWDEAMELIVSRCRSLQAQIDGARRIAFYTSGQLALEDYYTLGVIGKAGLGTPHMDANTRLCTATAASSLKASFGTDGQPGSYTDVDHCDAIALWGHNVAETQVVLWERMLDRRAGPRPPRMLAVDPRRTHVAREADLHLAPRLGTNLALVNGILREVIARGWCDDEYVAQHTIGFDRLAELVATYTPERVEGICDVAQRDLIAAAELVGTSERLLSTVLQGFYQSNQATASACAVNDLHLLRGMIGRPGAGVLQMNGQPTAQNNRESGANGDLPGFRNWANPQHVSELARLWNVEEAWIPHSGPPTPAMQIFRLCEEGQIDLLWIVATNPAVSLPDLPRIRQILSRPDLLVVVQDLFPTETVQLADVVLPAATWGERVGTFTNADRTVHLSDKAVDAPGEARVDLDIFLDFAARMDLRDRDGGPLITWHDAEGAFEAWKRCSAGRPCDYTGLTYERLRGGTGIQWPCDDAHPDGSERLYSDGHFNTDPQYCETYGHDLATGTPKSQATYRAEAPDGRAILHATHYQPGPEHPSDAWPFMATTGRTVYQFHTRTKTGRTPELDDAAPDAWVEMSAADADHLGVDAGDVVRVESARGAMEAPVRIGAIRPGTVFIPFHYGPWRSPWDAADGRAAPRAANELTADAVDPVSKQPMFKVAAVRVSAVAPGMGPRDAG